MSAATLAPVPPAAVARRSCRVAVLQSNYVPWKGYFDIVRQVDRFVFYDDMQYTKHDWRNRNRIKTPYGLRWLSIPCGRDLHRLISEVRIDRLDWQVAHWRRLEASYRRAPYWSWLAPELQEFYLGRRWSYLSELNQSLVVWIARDLLGLATRFDDSRHYRLALGRTGRLVDLLEQVGATEYVTGPSARTYLEPARFVEAGIRVHYVDYRGYPEYPQLHGAFVHEVSILDLLFSVGPEALRYLQRWGPAAPRPGSTGVDASVQECA